MTNGRLAQTHRPEEKSAQPRAGRYLPADEQLLHRFAQHNDAAAFNVLVQRYGAMIFGACRRILGDINEAEDAFQATFLVLIRKARSIRRPELVGNWLYGVACRIARKAKTRAAHRKAGYEWKPVCAAPPDPPSEAARRELCRRLDAELQQLPTKYRAPLVLCYLEGLTNDEAARRLGWPTGSISYRLARGREMLRERLSSLSPVIPPAFLAALPALYLAPTLQLLPALKALVGKMAIQLAEGEALSEVASANVLSMAGPELRPPPGGGWTKPALILTVLTVIILSGVFGYRAATATPANGGENHSPASCHDSLTP